MIYQSRTGSALLISLIVLTLITVMSTVFFEKLFRFSKASEGIENSNIAYYKALGNIEKTLYGDGVGVNKYTPWNVQNGHIGGTYTTSGSDMNVYTGSSSVPEGGKGNSIYDSNYNIIGIGSPVQLVIPNGLGNWNGVEFRFRIPQIGPNTSTGVPLINSNTGYILWTFASSGAALFASGESNIFRGFEIDNTVQKLTIRDGATNSGTAATFGDFYNGGAFLGNNGANCVGYQCTLKLSLIQPVPTGDAGRNTPFLEYQIIFPPTIQIPSQYMNLVAEGYAYGFLRRREFQFPQITTNTALDFAVLQ